MTQTIQQIKDHLRIEHDFTEEDNLIELYWLSAKEHVEKYLGDDLPDPIPKPIQAAVMLLTGDLYANRERQGEEVLHKNHTYQLLLNPYRSAHVL